MAQPQGESEQSTIKPSDGVQIIGDDEYIPPHRREKTENISQETNHNSFNSRNGNSSNNTIFVPNQ